MVLANVRSIFEATENGMFNLNFREVNADGRNVIQR